jgi:tetratricopeptide (TPR) repeat protein
MVEKKTLVIISLASALALLAIGISKRRDNDDSGKSSVALLGSLKHQASFNQAVKEARNFYDLYGAALDQIKVGKYDRAIELLNQSLPHVKLGPEVAMVHYELAQIYRIKGNLELELKSRELIAKYTANPRIRDESTARASEIKANLELSRDQVPVPAVPGSND